MKTTFKVTATMGRKSSTRFISEYAYKGIEHAIATINAMMENAGFTNINIQPVNAY